MCVCRYHSMCVGSFGVCLDNGVCLAIENNSIIMNTRIKS